MTGKSRPRRNVNRTPEIEGNAVGNQLLLNLPSPECDELFSRLTFVRIRSNDILEEAQEPIKYAYFINSGVASVLNGTTDGRTIEVGMSGKEGCTGLPPAVGVKTSAATIICQVDGRAFRIPAQALVTVLR